MEFDFYFHSSPWNSLVDISLQLPDITKNVFDKLSFSGVVTSGSVWEVKRSWELSNMPKDRHNLVITN